MSQTVARADLPAPQPIPLVSHATISEIPILDVGPYLAGQAEALPRLAVEIRRACTEIGFFFIVNHGMPQGVVDRAFAASRTFFALPVEAKAKLRMNEHQCGWQPPKVAMHGDSFDRVVKPQATEAFKFTFDLDPGNPDYCGAKRFRGHNQWPDAAPSVMRRDLMEFLVSFDALGKKLLHPVATSLGAAPDFFDRAFERSSSMMRAAYYPVIPVEDDQLGVPGHTDLSFLTLIPPATGPGLQILLQSGQWIDQPEVPNAILVNTGDTLRRWTNDRYIATPHRVVASRDNERYSNIFFLYPDVDAAMNCVPSCMAFGGQHKYPPVTFGEFHAQFASRNFGYTERRDGA